MGRFIDLGMPCESATVPQRCFGISQRVRRPIGTCYATRMVAVAEYRPSLASSLPPSSSLVTLHSLERPDIRAHKKYEWLSEYEKQKNSIFTYYSIPNEIEFLRKTEGLSYERKKYYIEENVKRFLGEFVGKVPYTTIPYEIDERGFSYANMHVMDSYTNAEKLGSERERAENNGFSHIEQEMVKSLHMPLELQTTAFWISPPKIADYGFVFVMKPEGNGKVKEYILRYPEKQSDLSISAKLFQEIGQSDITPNDTNSFLRTPLFGKRGDSFNADLMRVMQIIGISDAEITKSQRFESSVDSKLGSWIAQFADSIIGVAQRRGSQSTEEIAECKLLLLSIYQQARDILSSGKHHADFTPQSQFSWEKLAGYAVVFAHNSNLPTAEAGSCPAFENPVNPLESPLPHMDNLSALNTLAKGTPLEKAFQNAESFACPSCGKAIPSGRGIETCPSCGMTKKKYGELMNGPVCD